MSDVVQINAALFNVEFIKHAVIANSQLEFGSALKALMREFPSRAPISSTLR